MNHRLEDQLYVKRCLNNLRWWKLKIKEMEEQLFEIAKGLDMQIKITTVYENVDQGFLNFICDGLKKNGVSNDEVSKFRKGTTLTKVTKSEEDAVVGTTTWELDKPQLSVL